MFNYIPEINKHLQQTLMLFTARYGPFVIKVPLNSNQPSYHHKCVVYLFRLLICYVIFSRLRWADGIISRVVTNTFCWVVNTKYKLLIWKLYLKCFWQIFLTLAWKYQIQILFPNCNCSLIQWHSLLVCCVLYKTCAQTYAVTYWYFQTNVRSIRQVLL